MRSRNLLAFTCLALLLLSPLTAAQEQVTLDIGLTDGEREVVEAEAGQVLTINGTVHLPARENTSWRAFLNASVDGQPLESAQQLSQEGQELDLLRTFTVPQEAEGNLTVAYEVTVQSITTGPSGNETGGNGTDGNTTGNQTAGNGTSQQESNATASWQTEETFTGTLTVRIPAPPTPPTGPPMPLIIGGVVVVLVAIGAVVAYIKWPRQYQHEAGPRSKAMQELEDGGSGTSGGGSGGAGLERKAPEVHPQVKILEARASDVRRMIELAKERHERGDITEHQFNMIREKKEAELQEIEEEIDAYRSGEA